jgi:hypothetical protein
MRPAGRASDTDVIGCNRLTAILVVGGNGFFGACVGYIDYIKDALEITRLRHSRKPVSATSMTPNFGLEISDVMKERGLRSP